MVNVQACEGVDIHRLTTVAELESWRSGFVDAYQTIFREPPYEEVFSAAEADAIYSRLTSTPGVIALIAAEGPKLVGFGIAVPLRSCPAEARLLSGLLPVKHTIYLAELGVMPGHQGRKLGRTLVKARLQLIDRTLYSHVVLRVVEGRTKSFEMYRNLHFTDMGVSMTVRRERIDGQEHGDVRHFMSRVLSQVHVDD